MNIVQPIRDKEIIQEIKDSIRNRMRGTTFCFFLVLIQGSEYQIYCVCVFGMLRMEYCYT